MVLEVPNPSGPQVDGTLLPSLLYFDISSVTYEYF